MAIPPGITKEHVLQAISEITREGIPEQRESTKFDLCHGDSRFPPKLVLSVACRIATGEELPAADFFGGAQTNTLLTSLGFVVSPKHADWSHAECYLAVWAYDQLDRDRELNKAALYREVSQLLGRTPKAVEYKVQNVAHYDPRPRHEKPISQAANVQQMLGEVFRWYWLDRVGARARFAEFVQRLTFLIPSAPSASGEIPREEILIEEGAPGHEVSLRRGRSRQLLHAGRAFFRSVQPDGRLRCTACGYVTPAGLPRELIQLHHTRPICDAGDKGRKLSIQDAVKTLLPVCPTCHMIAHAQRPPLELDQIRAFRMADAGQNELAPSNS